MSRNTYQYIILASIISKDIAIIGSTVVVHNFVSETTVILRSRISVWYGCEPDMAFAFTWIQSIKM